MTRPILSILALSSIMATSAFADQISKKDLLDPAMQYSARIEWISRSIPNELDPGLYRKVKVAYYSLALHICTDSDWDIGNSDCEELTDFNGSVQNVGKGQTVSFSEGAESTTSDPGGVTALFTGALYNTIVSRIAAENPGSRPYLKLVVYGQGTFRYDVLGQQKYRLLDPSKHINVRLQVQGVSSAKANNYVTATIRIQAIEE